MKTQIFHNFTTRSFDDFLRTPVCFAVFVFAIAAMAWPGVAQGEVAWEKRTITAEAELGAERVTGVYRFKNAGDKPSAIGEITTACGCTAAVVLPAAPEPHKPQASPPSGDPADGEKRADHAASSSASSSAAGEASAEANGGQATTAASANPSPASTDEATAASDVSGSRGVRIIEPGETGTLRLTLVVGDRRGPQVKTAKVSVIELPADWEPGDRMPEDAARQVVELTLKTAIPRAYTVHPRLLLWTGREAADAEKAVVIRVAEGVSFDIEDVTVSDDRFTARVETLRDGRIHRILVKSNPRDADEAGEDPGADPGANPGVDPGADPGEGPGVDASDEAKADSGPAKSIVTITTSLPQANLRTLRLVARTMNR